MPCILTEPLCFKEKKLTLLQKPPCNFEINAQEPVRYTNLV